MHSRLSLEWHSLLGDVIHGFTGYPATADALGVYS
jgi:hypothetical protein